MTKRESKPEKRPRGPAPEHLKLEGDWEDAVKTALTKPPAPPKEPQKRERPAS